MSLIILVSLLLMPSVFGIKSFLGKKNDAVNYATAKTRCSSLTVQGQLATWKSEEEYNAIAQIRADLGVGAVWVGLEDSNQEGVWKFIDNDDSFCGGCGCCTLNQWSPNEPNNAGTGEDCAELLSNSKLNDNNCGISRPYVCEITDSDAAVAGRAGTYFIGVNEWVSYDTAKSRCSSLTLSNGQLATWGSDDEYNEIAQIFSNLVVDRAWIGLDDLDEEGIWKFVDGDNCGGNCDGLSQWKPNEPNNGGSGEDCGAIEDYGNLGINDVYCIGGYSYICEFNSNSMAIGGVAIYDRPVGEPQMPELPQLPVSNEPNNNYYILEFTSMMDVVNLVSYVLNVIFLTGSCCFVMNAFKNKSSGYSQVKMYATEDEKL